MAWSYEIAHGDAMNKRWEAFCELAQALRARIIATNGSDSAAPTYTKADGSTGKAVTMADFVGPYPIKAELLEDNVDLLRAGLLTKSTTNNTYWCNATGTTRYTTVTHILDLGSHGSSWLSHDENETPEYWEQLFEAFGAVRYLFHYYTGNYPCSGGDAWDGSGSQTDQSSLGAAWTEFPNTISDTSFGSDSLVSCGWGVEGRRFVHPISMLTLYTVLGAYPDPSSTPGAGAYSVDFDALSAMYSNLVGDYVDGGWSIRVQVQIYNVGGSSPSLGSYSLGHNYGTTYPATSDGTYFYDGSVGDAAIDFGVMTISPNVPTSSDVGFTLGTDGIETVIIQARPANALSASGQTLNTDEMNWYLTDLGHPSVL